ncbi:unnamed protein product [Rangifer tarandus platyrhynchus]|uniref:Uncharacterized protein n=1 Tax=Rangifer tarandus platyrhynchus TaxID=3082113 RepID=A0ABN8Z4E8_RANTA|nr:unnamed protein product [Rangifer tarandus platyrhynchus]
MNTRMTILSPDRDQPSALAGSGLAGTWRWNSAAATAHLQSAGVWGEGRDPQPSCSRCQSHRFEGQPHEAHEGSTLQWKNL